MGIIRIIYVFVLFPVLSEGEILYHQTMTPSWLEAHASYIDSSRTSTTELLTFNAGSVAQRALLKVPLIPPGALRSSTPLTIEITVANDVSIGQVVDSDTRYGVSDGARFIGFQTRDRTNYNNMHPCYGVEGVPGKTLSPHRYISQATSKPRQFMYPGRFVFTIKLDERWGSCYTPHDGGYVKNIGYNNRLMLSKGLTFEVYSEDSKDRVGIKYIKVVLIQDV
ncbi:hypothetical protein AWC38_SpisGene19252 [Stylophora pistillata]|uniref:Uncharacterized protein n=2 Tax=Stylophora pistillata TaxID=50429 RepID=A0A2B4RH34_STYPI|nr:hypothetical protein AWC38_SpisGene19252 [Stylophora pistillata]